MVSNQEDRESRKAIFLRELLPGVTRCRWVIDGKRPCEVVHGTRHENVDGTVTERLFEFAVINDGEVLPICGICKNRARLRGVQVHPLDEAIRIAERELERSALDAPADSPPVVAPPPVIPPLGRTPAVRKDVPTASVPAQPPALPVAAKPAPAPVPERRGPHPRSKQAHANTLRAAASFDAAFTLKGGGLCSCGACDEKAGNGFVTKNGDYQGKRYPLCGIAVREAIDFATKFRNAGNAGRRPPILVFRDQADWNRFDKNREQEAERRQDRATAVLKGQLVDDRKDVCGVRDCSTPKPTYQVARIAGGKVVLTPICKYCGGAARTLITELREAGRPWAVHILREGEKLSGKAEDMLQKGTRRVQEQNELQDALSRQKRAPQGPLATIGERVASKQKPKAAKPKASAPAASAAVPDWKAKLADIAAKDAAPGTEPVIAPVPEAAPATPAPQEGPMGGGNG